ESDRGGPCRLPSSPGGHFTIITWHGVPCSACCVPSAPNSHLSNQCRHRTPAPYPPKMNGEFASSGRPFAAKYLHTISQKRIAPPAVRGVTPLADLIDQTFLSYNAGRLREACQLFVNKMLEPSATVGLALSGALTPAGLGLSCLIPLLEAGFIDWVVSTGANLYHDTHFALGMDLHQSRPALDHRQLREHQGIRISHIVLHYENRPVTSRFY